MVLLIFEYDTFDIVRTSKIGFCTSKIGFSTSKIGFSTSKIGFCTSKILYIQDWILYILEEDWVSRTGIIELPWEESVASPPNVYKTVHICTYTCVHIHYTYVHTYTKYTQKYTYIHIPKYKSIRMYTKLYIQNVKEHPNV